MTHNQPLKYEDRNAILVSVSEAFVSAIPDYQHCSLWSVCFPALAEAELILWYLFTVDINPPATVTEIDIRTWMKNEEKNTFPAPE